MRTKTTIKEEKVVNDTSDLTVQCESYSFVIIIDFCGL